MSSDIAPFSKLSQELIDEIIDALLDPQEAEHKISQFCDCALVCRAFRHRSQNHAFYSMRPLQFRANANCRKRVDDLHGILQENPRIASYIRRLDLIMNDTNEWLFDDSFFCEIMEIVSKTRAVVNLELSVYGWPRPFQFTNNRTFETRFVKPFITPFITSLDLHFINNIPVSLLAHCPHLLELKLVWVTVEAIRPFDAIDIDHSLCPRPRKFTFESCGDTIRILVTGYVDFGNLQHLSVSGCRSDELDDVNLILDTSSSSLQHLHLGVEDLEARLDLGKVPNLASLSIFPIRLDEDSLVELCNLLRTIPNEKFKIKTIALGFKEQLDDVYSLAEFLEKLEASGPLCAVLIKLAERELLVVKFMLDISLIYDNDMEGILEQRNTGMQVCERLNTEMQMWVAKNLELTNLLSSTLCLEYDYEVDIMYQ
ncbi:hypothetical protein GALMADRAFT_140996 [Galerina marginata CBS 339.88]|uniref:F-box domain-containing protein n=1 Tax=Galerina marginata (strain CBS 339.88) TaxID=685588 RepID=A0A067SX40_GALM3|nr:hypothetical protein GALMADRAFT_140996 [Galerina marginata CBS 339.88]